MKKIFIGDSTLFLCGKNGLKKIMSDLEDQKKSATTVWITKKNEDLPDKIAWIESSQPPEAVVFVADSAKELEKYFFSLYKPINAAGGAVFNPLKELLMIFRRGKWDLPKGKIDEGETARKGALREIREETGIRQLKIKSAIKFLYGKQDCTYHTYVQNGMKIIKATYWFRMVSNDTDLLTPQEAEGIEKVEWCTKEKVYEYLKNSFHSIEEVATEAMK